MMELVRWNPLKEMSLLRNQFSSFFSDPFFPAETAGDEGSRNVWHPAVDIFEKDSKMIIKAELPGMDKKDISLDIQNGVLTLRGERTYENEVKEENFYRREMSHGSFVRSFTLPVEIDSDQIKAEFKDGILTIEVPTPETRKPKQITVH
jgi:HSP20 family protein